GGGSPAWIEVPEKSKSAFWELMRRKVHRYVIFKIDDRREEIVVEKTGAPWESYDDFTASLPADAVYDLDFVSDDNCRKSKIFFISWLVFLCPCFSSLSASLLGALGWRLACCLVSVSVFCGNSELVKQLNSVHCEFVTYQMRYCYTFLIHRINWSTPNTNNRPFPVKNKNKKRPFIARIYIYKATYLLSSLTNDMLSSEMYWRTAGSVVFSSYSSLTNDILMCSDKQQTQFD
ncbi:Os07g0297500, partial [Oryza sativa Japonica Group]